MKAAMRKGRFFMPLQVDFPVVPRQVAEFVHVCRIGDEVRLPIAQSGVIMRFNRVAKQLTYPGLM